MLGKTAHAFLEDTRSDMGRSEEVKRACTIYFNAETI
jgi:hypothetical protein